MSGRSARFLGLADRLLGASIGRFRGDDLLRVRLFVLMLVPLSISGVLLGVYAWALGSAPAAVSVWIGSSLAPLYVLLLRAGVPILPVANLAALQVTVVTSVITWINGGTTVPAALAFAILPMVQFLLMPFRWALAWGFIISAVVIGIGYATATGLVVDPRFPEAIPVTGVIVILTVSWAGMGVSAIFYVLARDARGIVEHERDTALAANAAKTTLVADMSHELRTPMNGVIGMLDLVLDGQLPELEHNRVRVARDSAVAFVGLLDGITDTTRMETGRFTLDLEPFSPNQVFDQVTRSLRPSAESRGLSLSVEADRLPPSLEGDALRIRQVLVNLISNAIKYTDRGGVTVRSGGTMEDEKFVWRVQIIDTGIGISDDDKTRIFGRFEQTEEAERRRTGSGLGLAITTRLVGAMGGAVELDSALGKGTTVILTIPLRRARITPTRLRHESYESLRPLPREAIVLLVDDDPVNRTVARASLEALGCRVIEACDGYEALELAPTERFDLILMDCQMPRLDGRTAARRIRADGLVDGRVPIVALTASVTEEDREACHDAGMEQVVSKPISRSVLRRVVSAALRQYPGKDDDAAEGDGQEPV